MRLQAFRAAVLCVGLIAVGQTPAVATGPVVSSFSPTSGIIGTTVTLTGSGFTGATKVVFNTAKSRFTVKSASKITAIVPTSASTGPIKVTTPGGTAASAKKFTVKPSIVLSAPSGPPTTTVKVSGAGFSPREAVDIYFDTTDEALTSASATGTFSGIVVGVPASAVPGTHHVTAVGRHSGFSTQAPFLVNTNWTQFRYSPTHSGTNPYENVLSPSSVSGLALDWSFTTGGGVQSSPAVVNGVLYVGSNDGNVYALNASTGTKLWSFTTSNTGLSESSPAVVKGVVYIGSNGGHVYALNAATGPSYGASPPATPSSPHPQ
jgi:PQQ-like domain/IPT/TIG domain